MPDVSAEHLSHLIGRVYEAGLNVSKWQGLVDQLSEDFEGVGVSLLGHDLSGRQHLGALTAGFDPHFIELFETYFASINPWSAGIAASPAGVVMTSDPMVPREHLVRTEFYNDWLRPQDNLISGVGVVAQSTGSRFLALTFTMPSREDERFHDELVQVSSLLGPHLRRAFELSRRLAGADTFGPKREQLGSGHSPVFLIDARGHISTSNPLGESLRTSGAVVRDGVLSPIRLCDARADAKLQRSLAAIRNHTYSGIAAPFPILCKEARLEYTATVAPYVPEIEIFDDFLGFVVDDRPVAVLLLTPTPAPDAETLRSSLAMFGLTPAEQGLALAIHGGHSLQSYADEREISIHTARNQLRAVFDKLDVRRQSELAVTIGRLAHTSPEGA